MIYQAALLVLCFFLTGWSVDFSAIPNNRWVEMYPAYAGGTADGSLCTQNWNNKGVYDPVSHRVIVLDRWCDTEHGGSIYANALLAYDPFSNVVTVLKINNYTVQSSGSAYYTVPLPAFTTDSTPVDRHPMGNLALDFDSGRIYLSNGYNQTAPANADPNTDTWSYSLSRGKWSFVSNASTTPPNPPFTGCTVMHYDPINKVIVCFANAGGGVTTWILEPTTNQWHSVAVDPTAVGLTSYGSAVAYDSKRGLFLLLGAGLSHDVQDHPSPALHAYSVSQNKWTRLADCPVNAPRAGFDYDSRQDVFLAQLSADTYIYHPDSDTWTRLAAQITIRSSVWYGSPVTYDSTHDVFVFEGGNTGYGPAQWIVFRYDSATASSSETALSAAALSRVQVYPNPVSFGNSIMFSRLPKNSDVRIYAVSGRLIRTLHPSNGSAKWGPGKTEGKNIPAGIYLFQISLSGAKSVTGKFTVLR